jgi:hypothetical protein
MTAALHALANGTDFGSDVARGSSSTCGPAWGHHPEVPRLAELSLPQAAKK